jgi:hypothetical protein
LPKRLKQIVVGVCVALGLWYAAFAALIVMVTLWGPAD